VIPILLSLVCGSGIGFLLRKQAWIRLLSEKTTMVTVHVLLLLLGVQLGDNREVLSRLDTVGVQAAVLAAAGLMGSVLASVPVSRLLAMNGKPAAPGGPEARNSHAAVDRKPSPRLKLVGSFTVLGAFAGGIVFGLFVSIPGRILESEPVEFTIWLLVFLVGMETGRNTGVWRMLGAAHIKVVLVPISVVAGTLLGSLGACFLLPGMNAGKALAVGSGFGYYSLSSIIVTRLAGSYLGTVALLTNLFRESLTLAGGHLLAAVFGKLAPAAAGGATAMDVTLPVVIGASGREYAVIGLFSGITLTLLVPVLVPVFL
jgi:uncharacterized membrane protein YbjE (DUF340 family)